MMVNISGRSAFLEFDNGIFYFWPSNVPVLSMASVVVVCNAAGGRTGRVGGRTADTAGRASTVTSS